MSNAGVKLNIFKGGVHPGECKGPTDSMAITRFPTPEKVVIPMRQHIGAPCQPLVQAGDKVKLGQKIGDTEAFVSAPIHASVSGEVESVGPYNHPQGGQAESVTIISNGNDTWHEDVKPIGDIDTLSPDEILKAIRDAGIVGLGGATFPAHVKLKPPAEKPIDTVIINGAECEPYLTGDHRLMLERAEDMIYGLKLMMKVLNAPHGYIGVEKNKPDAIKNLQELVAGEPNIAVAPLPTKYPQGAEKMLIYSITKREVPSGGLPMDVGVVNHNVGSAIAIAEAIREGKPLVERVATVDGAGIKEPGNLKFRVGTLISEILQARGWNKEDTRKLIIGGPMMGMSQTITDLPAIKGTSGILALTEQEVSIGQSADCIKCSKCVEACPIKLIPTFIAQAGERGLVERAESYHALDCIECGCCSFGCPAGISLTEKIRDAKKQIMDKRKA